MKLGRREKYQPIQYCWAGCLGYPVHTCHLPIDIQQIYCSAQTGQHSRLRYSCCPVWALQHICTFMHTHIHTCTHTADFTDSDTRQRIIYNTGLSTFLSGNNPLIRKEQLLVTAHEVGHNWGSHHDPGNRPDCRNNFLMNEFAQDGSRASHMVRPRSSLPPSLSFSPSPSPSPFLSPSLLPSLTYSFPLPLPVHSLSLYPSSSPQAIL